MLNFNKLTANQQVTIMEVTHSLVGAIGFYSGFRACVEVKTKRQKKTDEIMALQQELINVLADGNRDFTMTSEDYHNLVDTKMEFLNMVYLEAGYKEV